jgi:hypothetical protein
VFFYLSTFLQIGKLSATPYGIDNMGITEIVLTAAGV